MKIGIYGGTFDPVHKEHVKIAEAAISELLLDKLIILPSGKPPHKNSVKVTGKKHRLEMCKLAFNHPKMEVSTYEIDKGGKNYTCDTLKHFRKKCDEIYFIMGGDSLSDIHKWKNPQKIFDLATVVVVGREGGYHNEYMTKNADKIRKLSYEPEGISSTEIRIMRDFDKDVSVYVPSSVNKYIKKKELYQKHRKLTKIVEKATSDSRYDHIMRTTICGMKLARDAGVDVEDVFTACTVHDIAKCMKEIGDYKKKLKEEKMLIPEPVIHSFVGSYMIKKELGIRDKDIINAVKYHTTGRPNMSQLEKLVYVADCIEDGRDYDGVETLRSAVKADFEDGFLQCLLSSCSVIDNKTMCPLTLDAIEFYKQK